MVFKPVGIDENGNLPARARAALAKASELAAVFSKLAQTPQPQETNVVGFAGDSITNASGASVSSRGYAFLVRWVAGTRTVDQVPYIYATGGYTSAQVLATHIPNAAAGPAAVIHLAVGTNDAGASVSVAEFSANVIAAHQKLLAAGKRMSISLIPPRASAAGAAFRQYRAAYNEWISRWAPLHGVPVADTSALVDATTGNLRTDCDSGDGTHPNDLGHALIAKAVAAAVTQILPVQPHRQAKAPDVNLLTYGVPSTAAAGLPTGWSEAAGGTGDAPTYSTVTDAGGNLKEGVWVQMDWNATTTGGKRVFKTGSLTLNTGWAAGDQIEGRYKIEVEDLGGFAAAVSAGTASVRAVVLATDGTTQVVSMSPAVRATPGVKNAFRFSAPNTTYPAMGWEVVIPAGVRVKVRVGEAGWVNLTALGVTKDAAATGTTT